MSLFLLFEKIVRLDEKMDGQFKTLEGKIKDLEKYIDGKADLFVIRPEDKDG